MMNLSVGDRVNLAILKEALRQPLVLDSEYSTIIVNPEHVKAIEHGKKFKFYLLLLTDDTVISIHVDPEGKITEIKMDYG
ncbi:hypothetical protein SMF1_0002 [Sulfolobales Mexican fusellovirus 1]|uniref:hypothetical protein n=1 Tax=Sulfolobales Mexican fusellovirus 1 TaxID=1298531 RepID=UPI0002C07140|nr:hypothetical protein SMF1_0002 [Sulfolobales Mexican fusellovirus 1]AGG36549.1 hypothetical protein SMF1_0002 [Sulfolobales Mexican fusellovirus 1]